MLCTCSHVRAQAWVGVHALGTQVWYTWACVCSGAHKCMCVQPRYTRAHMHTGVVHADMSRSKYMYMCLPAHTQIRTCTRVWSTWACMWLRALPCTRVRAQVLFIRAGARGVHEEASPLPPDSAVMEALGWGPRVSQGPARPERRPSPEPPAPPYLTWTQLWATATVWGSSSLLLCPAGSLSQAKA